MSKSRRIGLFSCNIHDARQIRFQTLGKGISMRRNNALDSANLVRAERRRWQENHLLAEGALNDFQKLSDEAFRSMKAKYYRPADLFADMQSRRLFRLQTKRAVDPNSASVNR
jgi:hypothetical protein